jgi:hypothetical protein
MEKVGADWDTSFLFSVCKIFVCGLGLPLPDPTTGTRLVDVNMNQVQVAGIGL